MAAAGDRDGHEIEARRADRAGLVRTVDLVDIGAVPASDLWIGGSPCSGKSTVAAVIAAARGLPLYSCDDAFERHAVVGGPTLRKVAGMTIGARLAQPV